MMFTFVASPSPYLCSYSYPPALSPDQGYHEEAAPLYERVVVIWEALVGSAHPQVAVGLDNLAKVLQKLVRTLMHRDIEYLVFLLARVVDEGSGIHEYVPMVPGRVSTRKRIVSTSA